MLSNDALLKMKERLSQESIDDSEELAEWLVENGVEFD